MEICLSRLSHNVKRIAQLSGSAVFAVLKADAYGHGAVACSQHLATHPDIAGFAVSLIEEGIELREAAIETPILIMGPSMSGGFDAILRHNMTPMISSFSDLEELGRVAQSVRTATKIQSQPGNNLYKSTYKLKSKPQNNAFQDGTPVPLTLRAIDIHIKFNTGMHRLGFAINDAQKILGLASSFGLSITGVSSHLGYADAESKVNDMPKVQTEAQLAAFAHVQEIFSGKGMGPTASSKLEYFHIANTAGALYFPESALNSVRCGLGIYGGVAYPEKLGLLQVASLFTQIAQTRYVEAGDRVSYGGEWTAPKSSRLAILPIGYADGLPGRLSGKAQAIVHGVLCPLVGRICMDIALCDISQVPRAQKGDPVCLLGGGEGFRQNLPSPEHAAMRNNSPSSSHIAILDWAKAAGISPYEVTCGVSKRVPRRYVE